jgi:hypothetical protein
MLILGDYIAIALLLILVFKAYMSSTEYARFTMKSFVNLELMQDHYREAKSKVIIYRFSAIGFAILLTIVVLNFRLDFTDAWVILALLGSFFAISMYLIGDLDRQVLRRKTRANPDDKESLLQLHRKDKEISKSFLVTVAVTIILSGNWAFQVQKNEQQEKVEVISDLNGLSGQGWCSDFADIDVYDGGETVIKSGGWPCIVIASISGISFPNENGREEVCFYASFNVENGFPGEESFTIEQGYERYCKEKDEIEGWSEYSFEQLIAEDVRPDLRDLTNRLCRDYGYRMSYEIYGTYC